MTTKVVGAASLNSGELTRLGEPCPALAVGMSHAANLLSGG